MSDPSDEPSLPVSVGDVIDGKYRVDRVLGQGAMGFVVAATHLQLEQLVAIKFLLVDSVGVLLERFLREARATARLKCEHVCRVLDVAAREGEPPYIVMEYLAGRDLEQLLRARRRLRITEAVDHVLQACEGIAEAHGEGIIHRDLKPANLFLATAPDGTPSIKVVDFGLSKDLAPSDEAGPKRALTQASVMLGSPAYMSPEQVASPRDVDARTDIWALGAVLYELVTGRPPFDAPTLPGLLAAIARAAATPPSQLRPEVPAALDAAILRCLEKERAVRFATVAHLAAALAPLASEEERPCAVRAARLLGLRDFDPTGASADGEARPAADGLTGALPAVEPLPGLPVPDGPAAAGAPYAGATALGPTQADPTGDLAVGPTQVDPTGPLAVGPTEAFAAPPAALPSDPGLARPAEAVAPTLGPTIGAPAAAVHRPLAPTAAMSQVPPPSASEPATVRPRSSVGRWLAVGGGALLLLALVVGVVWRVRRQEPRVRSVAPAAPAAPEPCDHPPSSRVELGGAEPTGCSAFLKHERVCVRCEPSEWGPLEEILPPAIHKDMHRDITPRFASFEVPLRPGGEVRVELLWGEQSRWAVLHGPRDEAARPEHVGVLEPVLVPVFYAPRHTDCGVRDPVLLIDGCQRRRDLRWLQTELERLRAAGVAGPAALPAGMTLGEGSEGEGRFVTVKSREGLVTHLVQFNGDGLELFEREVDRPFAKLRLDVGEAWWLEQRDRDGRLRYRRLPPR